MDVRLKIDIDISDAMNKLNGMEARSVNFKPVFLYAKKELEMANAANFTSQGLPVGGWKPRTQVYAWPIMVKTGRLFSSLTNLRGPSNDIGWDQAVFGTDVEYAKFHQQGTSKMPKRLVLFTPPLFEQRLARIAAAYIEDGMLPD